METTDWSDEGNLEITNRGGELLYKFLVWSKDNSCPINFAQPDIKIGSPPTNWKSRHKEDVIALFVECAEKGIAPPDDLVEVGKLIRGKNVASVWSAKKYMVLAKVAQKFPPPLPGKKVPSEIVQYAASLLVKMGGIRGVNFKTGSGNNDYRKDFRYWCRDDAFLKEWDERHQFYRSQTLDPQFLAVVAEAIAEKP